MALEGVFSKKQGHSRYSPGAFFLPVFCLATTWLSDFASKGGAGVPSFRTEEWSDGARSEESSLEHVGMIDRDVPSGPQLRCNAEAYEKLGQGKADGQKPGVDLGPG